MKTLSTLLIIVIISITYAQNQEYRCKNNNGRCVLAANVPDSCQRLSFLCPRNSICCKINEKTSPLQRKKGSKRKCRQRKKCVKAGGRCVKRDASCLGESDNGLCKGASCTCCRESGLILDTCQCGQRNEVKVVGGEETIPYSHPWMVGLYVKKVLETGYVCGGTLISDRYVLTAAHCVLNLVNFKGTYLKPKWLKIGLADHDQSSKSDGTLVKVEEIIVQEEYDPFGFEHDIALIKLKTPLDLTADPKIKPVCLPADDSKTYEGEDGISTGWGYTDYDTLEIPDNLMEVTVPILGVECKNDFPEGVEITENMLCAGLKKGGKDACNGDSGGPLVVKEGSSHILVGIVSFGFDCGQPNVPGVYTRVTEYLDWIEDNTSDGNTCSP